MKVQDAKEGMRVVIRATPNMKSTGHNGLVGVLEDGFPEFGKGVYGNGCVLLDKDNHPAGRKVWVYHKDIAPEPVAAAKADKAAE